MDDSQRRRLVTEYIYNNPDCNKESVVKAMYGKLSRVPVLKTIADLCEDNIVIIKKENQNSRDHKMVINTRSILLTVSKELDDFEKSFCILLKKVGKEFDRLYLKNKQGSRDLAKMQPILNLLSECFHIFYEIVDSYLVRSVLQWSKVIGGREFKKQIYSTVFTKIADIHLRMSETLSSTKAGYLASFAEISFQRRIYSTENLVRHFDSFVNCDMENEIKDVLDSIWNINNDFKQLAYPEPVLYGWKFDYGVDGWKKLIEMQKQNPDKTYYRAINAHLEAS
jgi:hypothetical protein